VWFMSIKVTKTARDHGYFCGYASIFGHADKSGDVVMPGAFKRSLKKPGGSGGYVRGAGDIAL
ncbi:MAG: HK97 family phage prohead protease, partial [Devosiaceae bacterium]|nr:HK97 family phage prohead protease [Devosiaceae bacterium]